MSKRRMFSPHIVESDAFLDMPLSSQALYYHLGMNADDDGFVNPKRIVRMIGANDDDLKILIAKRFILIFESGIVVVKHWKLNNFIRGDRYSKTTYNDEMAQLMTNEAGAYTERQKGNVRMNNITEVVNQSTTSGVSNDIPNDIPVVNLVKVRLGKVSKVSKDTYVQPDKPEARQSAKLSDLLIALNKKVGGSEQAKITKGRMDKLKARLKAFTPKELMQAAEVIGSDAYLQGDNPRSKRYGTIDFLLRNDEKIAECLEDGTSSITANISNLAEDINSGKYL